MDRSSAPQRRNASFPRRRRAVAPAKRRSSLLPRIESLESRQMLDASFVVSEIMALNTKTIRDEDLAFSDWIEIRNDGTSAGDLNGHFLTNNAGQPTQWQLPAGITLDPGEHLVVFASGKDRANADEPHTNFTLDHAGGTVQLVAPNGSTIVSQLADYPALVSDQSYGLIRATGDAELINQASPAKINIPADGSLGSTWTGGNEPFNDTAGAGWIQGTGVVGYDTSNGAPNFDVKVWYSNITITNLAQSDAAIAGQNVTAQSPYSATPLFINYKDDPDAGDGNYAAGIVFPGNTSGDNNNFVMRATTTFYIRPEQAGIWTFGFNSDDGGRLRIDGNNVIVDDVNHGPTDLFGTVNLAAGPHTLEYVYWEQGGGAEAELFAAQGVKSSWDASFTLVGHPSGSLPLGSLDEQIDTDIQAAMFEQNASAYVRYPFTVTNPADVQSMSLDVTVDDGYVIYLNGVQVATNNAPATLDFNSAAASNAGVHAVTIDLTSRLNLLQAGQNVIAVQGLNSAANDGELLLDVSLDARVLGSLTAVTIDLPTPGTANGIIEPLITEFQASNKGTIQDEDGESSDWIEIHNPGTSDINLAGWSLTDDALLPNKWVFPTTYVKAGGYLVVFASDKNRATAGQQLHTNFKIAAEGDYLALNRPNGTPAWEFNPGGALFGPQFEDVSYGLRGSAVTQVEDEENYKGLVAYWDFEDAPGSTATDRSGNGFHGTLVNMEAADWFTGRIGARALNFNSTTAAEADDFVTTLATAATLDFEGRSKRTVAGWVRGAPAFSGLNGAVWEVGTGTGEFTLRNTSTIGSTWIVEQGNDTTQFTHSTPNIWSHVAVVYDGSNTIVYINGAEFIRETNTGLNTGGAGTFNFGKRAATNQFFQGGLDDLAVWDLALSPTSIAGLANTTLTPLTVPTINRNIGTTQIGFNVRQVTASSAFSGQVPGQVGGGADPLADADALLAAPFRSPRHRRRSCVPVQHRQLL